MLYYQLYLLFITICVYYYVKYHATKPTRTVAASPEPVLKMPHSIQYIRGEVHFRIYPGR